MKRLLQKLTVKNCSTVFIAGVSLFLTFNSQAQNISTIAGDGTGGYNGDGILATTAELHTSSGVAVDKYGNVFIADNSNHRIRKIDHTTGIISTVAGTGTGGYNGDGIAATTAELNNPWNLSLDTAGNIYIADWGNSRIRKVTVSTGMISTIAGTGIQGYNGDGILATTAELQNPAMVIADLAGNVYISDVDNQRIRKIDHTTGMISTVAGNGTPGYNGDGILATTAELQNPNTIALDSIGNIYIADYYSNEIRKVTVSTGMISAVAGSQALGSGYNGDGITATSAELNNPTGIKLDKKGNIYIGDFMNNRVREVSATTGMISTIAGTGTAGYNGDGILATTAEINEPWDLAVTDHAVYIAEYLGDRIRKIITSTTGIEEVADGMNITIYPNPVSDNLTVQMDGYNGETSFSLYNMLGQEVLFQYSNQRTTTLSVASLPSGIYFLKAQAQDGSIVTKKISVVR